MSKNLKTRVETDSLGEIKVPKDALWGAQTQRAIENFPISGIKFKFPFGRSRPSLINASVADSFVNTSFVVDNKTSPCSVKIKPRSCL